MLDNRLTFDKYLTNVSNKISKAIENYGISY